MNGVCVGHARTVVGAHLAAEMATMAGPDIECVLCAQERKAAEEEAAVAFHRQLRVAVVLAVLATVEVLVTGTVYSHTRHDHANPYAVAFVCLILQALVAALGVGAWRNGINEPMDRTDPGDMWSWYGFRVVALVLFAAALAMPLLGAHG